MNQTSKNVQSTKRAPLESFVSAEMKGKKVRDVYVKTLNLLRQSSAWPKVSANAHLSKPFNYNKMPLAPMGCKLQVHKKEDK
jgi:hypothetical protein